LASKEPKSIRTNAIASHLTDFLVFSIKFHPLKTFILQSPCFLIVAGRATWLQEGQLAVC
jgi:hypothetical protein